MDSTNIEQMQRLHFEAIGAQYREHYGDVYSHKYRDRFIHAPLFCGIRLDGMNVLEAMCGNGQTTEYLLASGARVTGLDISEHEIGSFAERWPDCAAHCASVFDSGFESSSFDCVAIVGGLHHLHPRLNPAIDELHRILKPGGHLCFAEPHRGSIPDIIRSFWYKHDKVFAANEASIDLDSLKQECADRFTFDNESYLGNIAYLLVLNSMVLRIPLRLKAAYAPALLKLEGVFSRFQSQRTACFVACQWQKK